MGPKTEFSQKLHQQKYRLTNESFEEYCHRISSELFPFEEEKYHKLSKILKEQKFIPGGRISIALGNSSKLTPFNCFVSRKIEDNLDSIWSALTEAGRILSMGGGIGYDFSNLRPAGEVVSSSNGPAGGPVQFMELFNTQGKIMASTGGRRSAQMGVLRCLAGNTRIGTLSGNIPISELCGTNPYLYCSDSKGNLYIERAISVCETGIRKTVRVHLDDGSYIDCTPDHRFMLSNGQFKIADDLLYNDSLMAFHKVFGNGRFSVGTTKQRKHSQSRLVANTFVGDCIGKEVHHIDEIPWNDCPNNLMVLTKSQHGKIHVKNIKKLLPEITSERKGKTLEEWLGKEKAEKIKVNMSKGQKKRAQTGGVWNAGMGSTEYKSHYKNGFKNMYSNHKVVTVEDLGRVEKVYDITMPKHHNFVAEGVFVHNCDHPDIESFVRCKQNGTSLSAFNLSVGIIDKFMEAVTKDLSFDLVFEEKVYKTIQARSLWNLIMRSNWDWAEPGVLFLDTINHYNNLSYCETISATNPCGEQVLPPNNCCLLGSFNLTKYLIKVGKDWFFDYGTFKNDIPIVVEAYDNLIDIAVYPTEEQRKEERSKRRIGLGITGLANTIEIIGHPYGSEGFIQQLEGIMSTLTTTAYETSIELARDRGQFPELDYHVRDYLSSPFILNNLSMDQVSRLSNYGIRNSHLISIAPTGTMSLCADNISSGIEPVFSYEYQRIVDSEIVDVQDYAYKFHGVKGRTIKEVTIDEHLLVLSTVQKYVDSSVSKTINISNDLPWEDFKDIYIKAWKLKCKGITIFREGGKREGIINSSCKYNPLTGEKECE